MAEMEDKSWLCDLALLVDITTRMNELNTSCNEKPSMQVKCTDI